MSTSPLSDRLEVEAGVSLHLELIATRASADSKASRRPVLLVNGLTMSTAAWEPLTRLLTAERTVVRYDMRGQGQSDAPPGPYRRERHALDLMAVLAELQRTGLTPLHVVALSNGAFVSQLVAAYLSDPELADAAGEPVQTSAASLQGTLASLVLLDAFAQVDAHLSAVLRSWLNALSVGGPGARFDAAAPWVWGPRFLSEQQGALEAARQLATEQASEPVQALTEGLLLEAERPLNLNVALHRFEPPLLVAMGENDLLTPLRTNREALALFGRNDHPAIIERAGHALPIENPNALAALLRPFFEAADKKLVDDRTVDEGASPATAPHEGGAPP